MKRNNKGITLIALVITIIVMLILVVVTINVATNGGLIAKAKKAADETKIAADLEEKQIEIITLEADGIENGYIVELADEHGNKYKYYRLDKVTNEQREKCIEKGIPLLMGDGNYDGKVDEEDLEILQAISGFQIIEDDVQKVIFDFYCDGNIDSLDRGYLNSILKGIYSLRRISIAIDAEIDEEKILVDEGNEKLYFVEEEVTVEEAKELEKFGVKKLIMGDVNLDGKITVEDADLVLAAEQGQAEAFNNVQKKVGDMNKNKIINSQDADLIRNMLNNN